MPETLAKTKTAYMWFCYGWLILFQTYWALGLWVGDDDEDALVRQYGFVGFLLFVFTAVVVIVGCVLLLTAIIKRWKKRAVKQGDLFNAIGGLVMIGLLVLSVWIIPSDSLGTPNRADTFLLVEVAVADAIVLAVLLKLRRAFFADAQLRS